MEIQSIRQFCTELPNDRCLGQRFTARYVRVAAVYLALLVAGCADTKPMPPENPAPLPEMKLAPLDASETKQPLNVPR